MDVIKKIKTIKKLQDEIDDYIWDVFDKYIETTKILFSDPNHYDIQNNGIHFSGLDGCMGCYDNQSVFIDMKFFKNLDAELKILEKQIKREKSAADGLKKREAIQKEKATLKRLKKKYPCC